MFPQFPPVVATVSTTVVWWLSLVCVTTPTTRNSAVTRVTDSNTDTETLTRRGPQSTLDVT